MFLLVINLKGKYPINQLFVIVFLGKCLLYGIYRFVGIWSFDGCKNATSASSEVIVSYFSAVNQDWIPSLQCKKYKHDDGLLFLPSLPKSIHVSLDLSLHYVSTCIAGSWSVMECIIFTEDKTSRLFYDEESPNLSPSWMYWMKSPMTLAPYEMSL